MRALWRLILAFASTGGAHGMFSTCSHECDDCEGPFYARDANGSCANRSSVPVVWYCNDFTCAADKMQFIRDEESCAEAADAGKHHNEESWLGQFGYEWSPSTGCKITSSNVKLLGLGSFKGQICFGMIRRDWIALSQLAAVVGGIIAGWLSGKFDKHYLFQKHLANDQARQQEFGPGAKAVAMHNVVGKSNFQFVTLFRSVEVIANVWVPAVLLWLFSPRIVLPLCFMLYLLPAFCIGGVATLSEPRFLITIRHCSLYGIRDDQNKDAYLGYLFSIFRPILLVGSSIGLCEVVKRFYVNKGTPVEKVLDWLINRGNFVQLGFQTYWGSLLAKSVFWITVAGTLLYMRLTIRPAFKTLFGMSTFGDCITLQQNDEKMKQFKELTNRICDAAGKDDEEDENRIDSMKDIAEHVVTRNMALAFLGLAVVDFFGYIYKVYAFLRNAKYFAAGVMTFALVESLTVLQCHGRFTYARQAYERTAKTGIPTAPFLSLCQWDDGMAGIPALFLSIYGLPLLEMGSPLAAFSSLFFLVTGTRALANYLGACVDAAMWRVEGRKDYTLPEELRMELSTVRSLERDAIAE